ncbi:MAG: hypothetical protein JOZ62_23700 [Acidobacteriaceae bacterium]|nr:hypothetical protein [Acidobacteriaceae bacterium]
MSGNFRSLAVEHHAFYEVSPYRVVVQEKHGSLPAITRMIQAGFDVDIYAVNIRNKLLPPGRDPDYALGYAELQRIAEKLSCHANNLCILEVIPFFSTVFFDARNHGNAEAMLQIRISHSRGLDQPFGLPEQRALAEVEHELRALGVLRR